MNLRLVSVLALALGFSLACGGGSTTTETPPPPPPPADGSIGVAECDAYIKKVDDCMGKLDATAKTAFESSSKQMVDAWKQAAATPEGKAGLAQGRSQGFAVIGIAVGPLGNQRHHRRRQVVDGQMFAEHLLHTGAFQRL